MSLTTARFVHQAIAPENTASDRTARPEDCWTFTQVGSNERPEIERFIRTGFLRAYGANLTRFFPVLMSLHRNGELAAACGLRYADDEPLFLETYFDAAIEAVLAAATGERVTRKAVIEVGNLAVTRAGLARRLIVRLTSHLHHQGTSWVVFSAVPSLRNNFLRLGIPLLQLGPADRKRLQPGAWKEWGSYYDTAPQVSAIRVDAAHAALARPPCIR